MKLCVVCEENEVYEENIYCIKCKASYCFGMTNVFNRKKDKVDGNIHGNLVAKFLMGFYNRGVFSTPKIKEDIEYFVNLYRNNGTLPINDSYNCYSILKDNNGLPPKKPKKNSFDVILDKAEKDYIYNYVYTTEEMDEIIFMARCILEIWSGSLDRDMSIGDTVNIITRKTIKTGIIVDESKKCWRVKTIGGDVKCIGIMYNKISLNIHSGDEKEKSIIRKQTK